MPAGLLFIPAFWEGEGLIAGRGYFFLLLVIMFSAFPITNIMLVDRKQRTIVRIMSTPTTTLKYLSQNFVACLIPLMIQVLFICGFGLIRYNWTLDLTLSLGLLYTLFAATSITFAFAWNCLFKNAEVSFVVLTTVMMFTLFFGVFTPVADLNNFLRTMGMLFPSYWASIGIEELLYSELFTVDLLMPMGILALFTTIFLFYGSKRGVY